MGGLKMLEIECFSDKRKAGHLFKEIFAKLVEKHPWKNSFTGQGTFSFVLSFRHDKLKLISLPLYCKECLDAWSKLDRKTPGSSYEANEII